MLTLAGELNPIEGERVLPAARPDHEAQGRAVLGRRAADGVAGSGPLP
jgi:hypothetical protein